MRRRAVRDFYDTDIQFLRGQRGWVGTKERGSYGKDRADSRPVDRREADRGTTTRLRDGRLLRAQIGALFGVRDARIFRLDHGKYNLP